MSKVTQIDSIPLPSSSYVAMLEFIDVHTHAHTYFDCTQ